MLQLDWQFIIAAVIPLLRLPACHRLPACQKISTTKYCYNQILYNQIYLGTRRTTVDIDKYTVYTSLTSSQRSMHLIWHFVIYRWLQNSTTLMSQLRILLQQTYTLSLLLWKLHRPHNRKIVTMSFMTYLLLLE